LVRAAEEQPPSLAAELESRLALSGGNAAASGSGAEAKRRAPVSLARQSS
jgi:hypothetical protein